MSDNNSSFEGYPRPDEQVPQVLLNEIAALAIQLPCFEHLRQGRLVDRIGAPQVWSLPVGDNIVSCIISNPKPVHPHLEIFAAYDIEPHEPIESALFALESLSLVNKGLLKNRPRYKVTSYNTAYSTDGLHSIKHTWNLWQPTPEIIAKRAEKKDASSQFFAMVKPWLKPQSQREHLINLKYMLEMGLEPLQSRLVNLSADEPSG